MKKLLISLAFVSATIPLQGAIAAEISRIEAEMKHVEAQMHKNAADLGKLREKHAVLKSQAYIESKNSELKKFADDKRSRRI